MLKGRQFNFNFGNRSPDTAWPHFDPPETDDQYALDNENSDINSGQCLNDDPESDAEEGLAYSEADSEDEQAAGASSLNMSSDASARFLELQHQMLQVFTNAQSKTAELQQRVTELEDEKLEIVRKEEQFYWTLEAELQSRIHELVQENERLSDELASKDEDDSNDELLRENARLVVKMEVMQTTWTEELSFVSKRREKDRDIICSHYSERLALLRDKLRAAEQNIENHDATTTALRAENAVLQRRLQDLKEKTTVLESRKAAPPRKRKKPAQSAGASENLRKLYVADLNSEFGKKLEEQNRIAKSQAASMDELVSQLRQRVAELERSRSTIETKNDQGADLAYYLKNALDEVVRLNAVVAEQSDTIHKQEHEYNGLGQRHVLSGGYKISLPDKYMKSTKKLEQSPATPSSVSGDSLEEEATSAASQDHLELPAADVTNNSESQYLDKEQIPENDAISEVKLDPLKETDTGLQEQVDALRRQNQSLQDKTDLLTIQEKKWRRTFEDFTHRAADVQRKDASKRQIKKGFKHLRKIIREGDLEGD